MSKKLMISCDEATTICDKNQYGEASRWDKMRLNLHMALCKHCKSYSKQNHIITKLLGKYLDTCDGSKHLSTEEKNELSEEINKKIEN